MAKNSNFNHVEGLGVVACLQQAQGGVSFLASYNSLYKGNVVPSYIQCFVAQDHTIAKLGNGVGIAFNGRLKTTSQKQADGSYRKSAVVVINSVTPVTLVNNEGYFTITAEGNLTGDARAMSKGGYAATVACNHYSDGVQYIDFFDSRNNANSIINYMNKGRRVLIHGRIRANISAQGAIDGYAVNITEVSFLSSGNNRQPNDVNGFVQPQPVAAQPMQTQPVVQPQAMQQPVAQPQPMMAQPGQQPVMQQPVQQPVAQPQVMQPQMMQVPVMDPNVGLSNDTVNYDVAIDSPTMPF